MVTILSRHPLSPGNGSGINTLPSDYLRNPDKNKTSCAWESKCSSPSRSVLFFFSFFVVVFLFGPDTCNYHSEIPINSLRPRRNRRHLADDIFKCIFLNENEWISFRISLKFVPKVRINNIPSLVQIMAWRPPGDKPLSEPMVVSLLTQICVTRPQCVKWPPFSRRLLSSFFE